MGTRLWQYNNANTITIPTPTLRSDGSAVTTDLTGTVTLKSASDATLGTPVTIDAYDAGEGHWYATYAAFEDGLVINETVYLEVEITAPAAAFWRIPCKVRYRQ